MLSFNVSDGKVCSFCSCAFIALCSSEHTCTQESAFFILPRNSNFEQSFSSKAHEITGIIDALKKNAHDQNEQIIYKWTY